MNRTERARQQNLERILRKHEDYEKRTLYDLRCEGYRFATVEEAKAFLRTQRSLAGMAEHEIYELAAARLAAKEGKK